MTDAQKESVFFVVKNFAEANDKNTEWIEIPEEVMAEIRKDRGDYMNGIGKNNTRKEARKYILRSTK